VTVLKKKENDEDPELSFFGLKSLTDTERGADLNGCRVEQIVEAEDDSWNENSEIPPLKIEETRKAILIGASTRDEDEVFIYILCDTKNPHFGAVVSKCPDFPGAKIVKRNLADSFISLLHFLEDAGHAGSSRLFVPDEFEFDDGEVDDDDGDYNDDDEDDN